MNYFLDNVDLGLNEIKRVIIDILSAAPTGTEGRIYYNSTTHQYEFYNGTTWGSLGGGGITALTGDVSASGSGSVSSTVNSVGGSSASAIATAVGQAHTQHTDTGTTNQTFQLHSGSSGVKLKNSSGEFQVRNSADNAYASFRALDGAITGDMVITGNLTVNGTSTILNTTTMETGDNEIVLNVEITTSAGNTDGGIAIKRLDSDNSTRRDAKIVFDEASTKRWNAVYGASSAAVKTRALAMVYAETIGDTSATQFTITHGLNSQDVNVTIRYASGTKEAVFTSWRVTGDNTVRVDFAVAPGTDEFRVIVTG